MYFKTIIVSKLQTSPAPTEHPMDLHRKLHPMINNSSNLQKKKVILRKLKEFKTYFFSLKILTTNENPSENNPGWNSHD